MFAILPEYPWWDKDKVEMEEYQKSQPLPDEFTYTSDNNDEWLTVDELKKIVADGNI